VRPRRRTEPLDTTRGILVAYEEIEPWLIDAEWKGRRWAFDRALAAPRTTPTDSDVLELHRVMFEGFLPWAGQTRVVDRGPGGRVPVPWYQVRAQLRNLSEDLKLWVNAIGSDPRVSEIAEVVARAHHRFQEIHPFHDTNGRTGRVLDAFLLWVTFGTAGAWLEACPVIEPFATEADEDAYYGGLVEADLGRPEPLARYYEDHIVAAFNALSRRSQAPEE